MESETKRSHHADKVRELSAPSCPDWKLWRYDSSLFSCRNLCVCLMVSYGLPVPLQAVR